MTLEHTFKNLLSCYTSDRKLVSDCWQEIVASYSETHRRYHTLGHLEYLLDQLTAVKAKLQYWNALVFAICYHDIIYDPLRGANEELSAELAQARMNQAKVPAQLVEQTIVCIQATRSHEIAACSDTHYFTDADLSILGQVPEVYQAYCDAIRQEYSIYPDSVYLPARKKILSAFLQMERIFKTDFFYAKYEGQARNNIAAEIWRIDNSGSDSN